MDLLDEDINVVATNYSEYFTLNEDIELVIFDFNNNFCRLLFQTNNNNCILNAYIFGNSVMSVCMRVSKSLYYNLLGKSYRCSRRILTLPNGHNFFTN